MIKTITKKQPSHPSVNTPVLTSCCSWAGIRGRFSLMSHFSSACICRGLAISKSELSFKTLVPAKFITDPRNTAPAIWDAADCSLSKSQRCRYLLHKLTHHHFPYCVNTWINYKTTIMTNSDYIIWRKIIIPIDFHTKGAIFFLSVKSVTFSKP